MYLKRVCAIVLLLCLIPLVTSAPDFFFQQDSESVISIPCIEADESPCGSTALVNLTIDNPDGSVFIGNEEAKFQELGKFTFNLSRQNNSIKGIYVVTAYKLSGNQSFAIFEYEINGSGKPLRTAEGILYIIVLLISFVVLALTVWGATVFPFRNPRDDMGSILNINNMKYVKVIFWVFAYLELLFIMSISRNITVGFLALDGLGAFFNVIFTILLILLLPFFPLLIWLTVVIWLNDKRSQAMLRQGIPVK